MDRTGFASIGAFKKMDSFIVSSTQQIPYGQTGLPLSLLVQGEDANTMFDVSQPIDGPGADIKGIKRTNNIDFQAHVSVRPGVRLIAEGINLTNQAIRQFASIDYDRPKVYTTAGRTFTFGVSAEF